MNSQRIPGVIASLDRPERRVNRLQERFGLADEQASEVAAIFQGAHQNGACRQIEDETQQRACRWEKRRATREEIVSVLAKEPLPQSEVKLEERRARHEPRREERQ